LKLVLFAIFGSEFVLNHDLVV